MPDKHAVPLLDDLGIYVLPGRVLDPARGLAEAAEAEALGFGRIWLSERHDLKEAGVLCGAMAARTERIGVATGLVIDSIRHPMMTAAFGATMQATFGDRFALGLTRGVTSWLAGVGVQANNLSRFENYVRMVKQLWAGEKVSYDSHLGTVDLEFVDKLGGPPPPVYWGTFGNEKAVEVAARTMDGVALVPFFTVEAVARTVTALRNECERIGRDPHSLRIIHCIVTAPDLHPDEELAIVGGRAVTYFQMPGYGDMIVKKNGWDEGLRTRLMAHPKLVRSRGDVADLSFHRAELMDVAKTLPKEWIDTGAAVGSAEECAQKLQAFKDVGVDELWLHGSSPSHCAGLVDVWRRKYSPNPAAA
jgi:5,10-methylenetetrahydromethanopterin reductase